MIKDSTLTRLKEYIREMLPSAHGHQLKGLTDFVAAIFEKQSGCQAALARTQGNQEAACRRLSRLLHNARLDPADLTRAICAQALSQLPRHGQVRLSLDWTTEDDQHLLVISLKIGRRAVPIFWRAYAQSVLKGRMKRYELAVIKRAFNLIFQVVTPGRLRLTADRGFPHDELFQYLDQAPIRYVVRVKGSTSVCLRGKWVKLNQIPFVGKARLRTPGWVNYCQSSPHRLYLTISRARDKKGKWQSWYLVSNRPLSAERMADEYGCRFCCEEGFRDSKWWLGFKQARIADIRAWARLFCLFVIALLALATLGTFLLLSDHSSAGQLLRRVASRRRRRCELSLIAATLSLIQQQRGLLECLLPFTKFKLDLTLSNMS
jgi:Transposase DDE domain